MSKKQMKERFEILGEEGQSFAAYCSEGFESCRVQLQRVVDHAARDTNGKPIIYTILRSVSRGGMTRTISLHYFDLDWGRMVHLNYVASVLLGLRQDRYQDGVIVKGCGMDMGFDLVYRLSRMTAAGEYALRHEWL